MHLARVMQSQLPFFWVSTVYNVPFETPLFVWERECEIVVVDKDGNATGRWYGKVEE